MKSLRLIPCLVLVAGCVGTPSVNGVAGTSPAPNAAWTPPATPPETTLAKPPVAPLPPDVQKRIDSLGLGDVVDIALSNNPTTQISWANARAAADAYGAAKGQYYPQLDLAVDAVNLQTVQTQGRSAVQQTYVFPNATINWLLLDIGGRSGSIGAAKNTLIAADWTHNATIQDVVLQVESALFNYLAARALLAADSTSVKEAQTSVDATNEQHKVGLATIADVLQARTALSQAKLNLQSTQGDYLTTRGALAVSMGLPANIPYDIAPVNVLIPVGILPDSVDTLITQALHARPDFAAARAQYDAALERIRVARAARLPSLALSGTGGRTYSSALPSGGNSYTLQLGVSIPVFAGFSRLYNQRQAEAEADAALAQATSIQQQVIFQVFSSYYTLQTAAGRVHTADDLLNSATQTEEVTLGRYKAGVGSILDLLTAQSALASARAQQIQARLEWRTALTQLAHDVGVLDTHGQSPLRTVNDTTGTPPPR